MHTQHPDRVLQKLVHKLLHQQQTLKTLRYKMSIEAEIEQTLPAETAPIPPVTVNPKANHSDLYIPLDRTRKPVLQHHFQTGALVKRFDALKDVQKHYKCCAKTLAKKIKNQEEFLGSRWSYDRQT